MPDPFEGTWSINLSDERSKAWDKASQAYVKDQIGSEVITLKTVDNVQHYEVVYGTTLQCEWGTLAVMTILNGRLTSFTALMMAAHLPAHMVRPILSASAVLRTRIKVDERTHYRIARSPHGRARGAMLRRLAEDGKSYKSIVLDVNGIVRVVRIFVRVED